MMQRIGDFLRDEERASTILLKGALAIMVVGFVSALMAMLLLR